MNLNAIIVDDETSSRQVLGKLLTQFCPEVTITGQASTIETAYELILEHKPDLVFLDIQMPTGNGFTLLKKFTDIPFSIIFVTSFDQYAINAIRFSALDYLLKPVEVLELKAAVQKAVSRRNKLSNSQPNIINLLNNLDVSSNEKKVAVHSLDKVRFVSASEIYRVEADGNYSQLFLASSEKLTSSKTLKEFEELLSENNLFIRLNKSCLININFIQEYSKGEACTVRMKDGSLFEVSRRKKQEVLERIKSQGIKVSER